MGAEICLFEHLGDRSGILLKLIYAKLLVVSGVWVTGKVDIMKIKSVELQSAEFAPYGEIMAGGDLGGFTPLGADDAYTYTSTTCGVPVGEECCSGMLICKNREMVFQKMEYHAHTSEILVALKNDYVLCVAPKNAEKPELDKLKAFKVKQGTVLAMSQACWHWIPFPLGTENADVLVIFKDKTGENDLIYADLPEPVEVEL